MAVSDSQIKKKNQRECDVDAVVCWWCSFVRLVCFFFVVSSERMVWCSKLCDDDAAAVMMTMPMDDRT